MQYQVYRKSDKVVVAWIDTNDSDVLLHNDYEIEIGENLKVEQIKATDIE